MFMQNVIAGFLPQETEIKLLLGLMFALFALVIAFVFLFNWLKRRRRDKSFRNCPFCSKLNRREATVCSYCQKEIVS